MTEKYMRSSHHKLNNVRFVAFDYALLDRLSQFVKSCTLESMGNMTTFITTLSAKFY